jgi:hypothetical protein
MYYVVALYQPSPNKLVDPQDIRIFSVGCITPISDYSIGSIVVVRSVKMLNAKTTKSDRSTWWKDLREELKRSILSIGCNTILEYR